jgi:trans-aconitate methyltransferase
MPYSAPSFDEVTKLLIQTLSPQRVLDIGCGAGKYGEMLRSLVPAAHLTGIESEASYIGRFKLDLIYDDVRLMSATDLIASAAEEFYDLVIIGDCIEHLPKSAGLDLLNFLTYRAAYILVICPEFDVQNAHEGVQAEAHISVWSERDFEWHDLWATAAVMNMMLFVLRGYIKAPVSLPDLVDKVNLLQLPLYSRTGKLIKKCRLELKAKPRTELIDGQALSFRRL